MDDADDAETAVFLGNDGESDFKFRDCRNIDSHCDEMFTGCCKPKRAKHVCVPWHIIFFAAPCNTICCTSTCSLSAVLSQKVIMYRHGPASKRPKPSSEEPWHNPGLW